MLLFSSPIFLPMNLIKLPQTTAGGDFVGMNTVKVANSVKKGDTINSANSSQSSKHANIFEALGVSDDSISTYSGSDLESVIRKLQKAQKRLLQKEREEEKRHEIEEHVRQKKAQLETEAKQVKEVSCIDLPLDWENSFN